MYPDCSLSCADVNVSYSAETNESYVVSLKGGSLNKL